MRRPGLRRWLHLGRRRHLGDDLHAELENHHDEIVDHLVRRGWPRHAAQAEATRRLGGIDDAARRLYPYAEARDRRIHMRDSLDSVLADLAYTLRSLARRPAFSLLVIATLALGIGANVAMFSIVDRVLVSGPAHVVDADRLFRFYQRGAPPAMAEFSRPYVSPPFYQAMRRDSTVFAEVAMYTMRSLRLGRGEGARLIDGLTVGGTFFRTLGTRPALGRFVDVSDVDLSRPPTVVVISHHLWQSELGGRPDVIGQSLTLNDSPYRIIGIAPPGFTGAELDRADFWMPMGSTSGLFTGWESSWSASIFLMIARLRDGVTPTQANDRATTLFRAAYTGESEWVRASKVLMLPVHFSLNGDEPMEVRVSRWLFGVALLVLLTAFANVANLLLARGLARQREIGVRLALGIQRSRLVRLLVAEGMVLAIAGAAVGLFAGLAARGAIQRALFPTIDHSGSAIDARLGAFVIAAALATSVLLAVVSIVQSHNTRIASTLKEATARISLTRMRAGAAFTVAQAALSMIMLVGSGLFVLSLARVQGVPLGLEPRRVIFAGARWPVGTPLSQRAATNRQVLEALRNTPGVGAASLVRSTPFRSTQIEPLRVPGRDTVPTLPGGGPFVNAVGPHYFSTVGTRLLAGRDFTSGDGAVTPQPVILSQSTAQLLFGDQAAALGGCVIVGDPEKNACSRVVGIVEDARRFALREEQAMQAFRPLDEAASAGTIFARVDDGDLAAAQASLRARMLRADPSITYVEVGSFQEIIDPKYRPWRLGASMFSIFGGLATIIAVIGLYSIVSYATAHRTHEIGVRIALGARIHDIMRMVIRSGMVPVIAGMTLGVLISLGAAGAIQPLLFETSARSPLVLGVVGVLLLAAGLVACLVPARRAGRVDPVQALRAE